MSDADSTVLDTLDTSLLMRSSAAFLAVIGLGASLFPRLALSHLDASTGAPAVLVVSVLGAQALGNAVMNWMARDTLIGGIYSRPVALGNATHFAAGAVVLGQAIVTGPVRLGLVGLAGGYLVFAGGFGVVVFGGGGQCG